MEGQIIMNSVQVKVAEQIAQLGPSIEDKVVDALVTREKDKRSDALVKVVDLHSQAEKELKKIKPDLSYMDETNKVTLMYSKSQLEALNKAKAKVQKHVNAINKALEKKDFGDVYNLANGKEPVGDDDTSANIAEQSGGETRN
jgi:DNA-directed RNA polymerase subunit F